MIKIRFDMDFINSGKDGFAAGTVQNQFPCNCKSKECSDDYTSVLTYPCFNTLLIHVSILTYPCFNTLLIHV